MRGPNMSYCMCENTLLAMEQIMEAMHEENYQFLQGLNSHERMCADQLFDLCEQFMTMYHELREKEDEAIDNATEA